MCEPDAMVLVADPMAPVTGSGYLWGTFRVGDIAVTQVSDGYWQRPQGPGRNWFAGIDSATWLSAFGLSDPETPFSVNFGGFVITGDGHITLVDCGWGSERGRSLPTMVGGGSMMRQLQAVGIAREDVDRVVLTHLHSDHCGHLIDDDRHGELTFPNATVYVHEDELRYWTSAVTDGHQMAPYVRSRLTPWLEAQRVCTFEGETSLSSAITLLPTPGHTPGHSSVLTTSRGEYALLLGDVAHHPIHLEHLDWVPEFDVDPEMSIKSRQRMAALAVKHNALVTAPHMAVLTLGRLHGSVSSGFSYAAVAASDFGDTGTQE